MLEIVRRASYDCVATRTREVSAAFDIGIQAATALFYTGIVWSHGGSPPGNRARLSAMQRMRKLKSGTVIESPATGRRYLIANPLGQGGYGCAYRVQRLDSWDRRIGELLPENDHRPGKLASRSLFWRAAESLRPRDSGVRFVPACFRRPGGMACFIAWSLSMPSTARFATILPRPSAAGRRTAPAGRSSRCLKLLDQLHGTGALHRDITPTNVFVCKNTKLKLGDFGLARHVLAGKMVAASAFTPFFVSKRMAEGERRYWLPSDDVFQMGQLLAMLIRGDAESLISAKDASKLPCDGDLQAIVAKAICTPPKPIRDGNRDDSGIAGSRLSRCRAARRASKERRLSSPVRSRSGGLTPRCW